ncbi:MAG: type 4a pilus biogenesis protein PilO [Candidatus Omnitrophota bacterium]|nr:type 4a pilus biogenesis protein PilO [Candidatus Omnitrophota bacterium]
MPKELSPKLKKNILIALGIALFLYIDCVFILGSQTKSLKSISAKLKTAKKDLAEYKGYGADTQGLQNDLEAIKEKSLIMENMVFGDANMSLLLDDISRKAHLCGVKILQINPQSQASLSKDKTEPSAEISGFKLQPIELKTELSSGYHQLGKFLSRLEENPLIAVSGLKIVRDNLDLAKQKTSLTLRVYVK